MSAPVWLRRPNPRGSRQLVDDLDELGFDSLWLPEVLTAPTLDPLVALGFAAAHNRHLKLGTTLLLPGRNLMRLAKELASLDVLSGGRLLTTFVPGLPRRPEAARGRCRARPTGARRWTRHSRCSAGSGPARPSPTAGWASTSTG